MSIEPTLAAQQPARSGAPSDVPGVPVGPKPRFEPLIGIEGWGSFEALAG
jgi:hypothetical protein